MAGMFLSDGRVCRLRSDVFELNAGDVDRIVACIYPPGSSNLVIETRVPLSYYNQSIWLAHART